MEITPDNINRFIDHTNVKPDALKEDIARLCRETIDYGFRSVCVSPFRVKEAKSYLNNYKEIALISVVGFPFGWASTKTKVNEAKEAIIAGATEIDMVINIGAVKEGDWECVKSEISEVVAAISPVGLKVIIEVGYLTKDEIAKAALIVEESGAQFVKTGTGYGPRGTEVSDIEIIRQVVGEGVEIKAAGGIRDFETAKKMINAGASRIGTSTGLEIIGAKTEQKEKDLSGSNE